jgi:hypothetical protein
MINHFFGKEWMISGVQSEMRLKKVIYHRCIKFYEGLIENCDRSFSASDFQRFLKSWKTTSSADRAIPVPQFCLIHRHRIIVNQSACKTKAFFLTKLQNNLYEAVAPRSTPYLMFDRPCALRKYAEYCSLAWR